MAKAKTKTRGANLPVPQNRAEASEALRLIGEDQRQLARIQADMNDHLAAAKETFERKAQPVRDLLQARIEGLKVWAEAHRQELTAGRTKTADLGTGTISWRLRPPSVTVRGLETVLDRLRASGLSRFIRVKEEVNKEAMLAEPAVAATVPGVSIGGAGEEFIAAPFAAELAEAS